MGSDGAAAGDGHTAAVCVRGHPEACSLESLNHRPARRCSRCGADVLTRCEVCGAALPGVPGREWRSFRPAGACASCGSPFPWLGLRGRLALLHGLLDAAGLDEARRGRAALELDALGDADLDGPDEGRRWASFKAAAPSVWADDAAQRIIATILDADTRLRVHEDRV